MSDDFAPNSASYSAACPSCGQPSEWTEKATNSRMQDRAQIVYLIDCPCSPEPLTETPMFDPLPEPPLRSLISMATWLRPNNRESA